MTVTFYCCSS